jgi:ABC-type transport system involved in Fe-S cluster assembly fused permease/ATPase subunit
MADIAQLLSGAATNPNALLINLVLPFLLIFAIVWGLLSMVNMFKGNEGRRINMIIALVLTIMVIAVNPFGFITGIVNFLANFSIWAFVVVFVFLVIIWAVTMSRGAWKGVPYGRAPNVNTVKDINKQIDKLYQKREEAIYQGNTNMANQYEEDIEKLVKRKDWIMKGSPSSG